MELLLTKKYAKKTWIGLFGFKKKIDAEKSQHQTIGFF
jgi:hypothetical protein